MTPTEDREKLIERIRMNAQMIYRAAQPPVSDLMQLSGALTALAEDAMNAANLLRSEITAHSRTRAELERALKPLANIALLRDQEPNGPDRIDAPDLDITPNHVRAAREAIASARSRQAKGG